MPVEILSVAHCNVNCSDLERSKRFYSELVGLEAQAHTAPEQPQDGTGFGLPRVQWDAFMMQDATRTTSVDLLEWKVPEPVGRPYPALNHLGFARLCLSVPNLDAVHARLRAAGVECLSEPCTYPIQPEAGLHARVLMCLDPDGTVVEFVEAPGVGSRLVHVNICCSDLARSADWYQRTLSLEVRGHSKPGPVPGRGFGMDGEIEWEAKSFYPKGLSESFMIDLLEWKQPAPVGPPYPSANHLGIFRMAFLVEDAHAAYDEIRSLGVECPPPVWLELGPEIPVEGVWAVFFPDPDGTCLEFIGRTDGTR